MIGMIHTAECLAMTILLMVLNPHMSVFSLLTSARKTPCEPFHHPSRLAFATCLVPAVSYSGCICIAGSRTGTGSRHPHSRMQSDLRELPPELRPNTSAPSACTPQSQQPLHSRLSVGTSPVVCCLA